MKKETTPQGRGASKMQDVTEFRRWYAEGREYKWMVQTYLDKYSIETTPAMFSNWRARLGLNPRMARRDGVLIPWKVEDHHAWLSPMRMLRAEARARTGLDLAPDTAVRLEAWRQALKEQGRVVHYDAETEQGFFYIPKREGVDTDLVRLPG